MQAMIDHLGAVLVGAVVLAALSAMALRSQTDGIEAASYHALQKQATSFGETVRLDLESLSAPISLDGSSGSFAFRARLTPHDTTQHNVVYQRVLAETRDGVPYYTISRTVDGVAAGGSPGLLKTWFIETQTRDGLPATTPDAVSQVYVALEVATPHEVTPASSRLAPDRIQWEGTIVPTILHYTSS